MVGGAEPVLLILALVLLGAKLGGEAARRLRQPPVVGELLVGVALGPSLLGLIPSFDILHQLDLFFSSGGGATPTGADFTAGQELYLLAILAEIGVLLLLFEVGLESSLAEIRRVGASAALVGTYGVVFSLILGAAASYLIATRFDWVLTDTAKADPVLMHVFVGAILTATSVGITARVLTDLGRIRSVEAQIVLAAAVFDDVLGLIVLAVVGGLVTDPGGLSALGVGKVFAVSLGFFFAAIFLGRLLAPRLLEVVHRSRSEYSHLGFSMIFMLLVAYLATVAGLAAIVGAFAAGLALSGSAHRHILFEHLKPVGSVFIGFFFVILGARVDLTQMDAETGPLIVGLGLAITIVAVFAKLLCGLGVVGVRASRLVVGVGMVPRGEVGMIFALFGLEHGLIANWQYTTILLVVLLTTLLAPFWLKALGGRFIGEEGLHAAPQARIGEATQS